MKRTTVCSSYSGPFCVLQFFSENTLKYCTKETGRLVNFRSDQYVRKLRAVLVNHMK